MPKLTNARHEIYANARAAGTSQHKARLMAGYDPASDNVASAAASRIENMPAVSARIAELSGIVNNRAQVLAKLNQVERRMGTKRRFVPPEDNAKVMAMMPDTPAYLERMAIDKAELLSEILKMHDEVRESKVSDLFDEKRNIKPFEEWPDIFNTLLIDGIDIEEKSIRSHDGKDKDGKGGWDRSGGRLIKIRWASRTKILAILLDMIGRHSGVGAFSSEDQATATAQAVMDAINRRLQEGRQRARNTAIDVVPEK